MTLLTSLSHYIYACLKKAERKKINKFKKYFNYDHIFLCNKACMYIYMTLHMSAYQITLCKTEFLKLFILVHNDNNNINHAEIFNMC